MLFVAAVTALFMARPGILTDENHDEFIAAWVLLSVLASIPVVRYEVASTAKRGQTYGKRSTGILVVVFDDQGIPTDDVEHPDPFHSLVRFMIPHGAGALAAVLAAVAAFPRVPGWGEFFVISGAAGLVPWTLVYASSFFDSNGRGWHDKAAGTIVVRASPPKPPLSGGGTKEAH